MGLFSFITTPVRDIYNSFKKGSDGLSGRKLSAFWAIVVAASVLSWKNTTESNAIQIIGMWLLFGAICLGMVTIPDLIKCIVEIKNGQNSKSQ